jgi:hypothetical protein
MGVNFFAVTVDMHWPVYEPLRRGLVELIHDVPAARDEIVIMGISYVTHPRFCHAPFAELLDAHPTFGRIDVSGMGATTNADFLNRWGEHARHVGDDRLGVRALAGLFDDGLAASVAATKRLVDLAFIGYRPSMRFLREVVLDKLDADSVPVFSVGSSVDHRGRKRLTELGVGPDQWAPRQADYVRYALGAAGMSGALCNPTTVQDMTEIVGALAEGPLTHEERTYLEDLADLDRGLAELAKEQRKV